MAHESMRKTIIVALTTGIVCSVLISATAVSLHDIQAEKRELDRIENILAAAGYPVEGRAIKEIYEENFSPVLVDLNTGMTVRQGKMDPQLNAENFDIRRLALSEAYGMDISKDKDIAGIRRMPKYMVVYLLKENNQTKTLVLPIYGQGLWSTMYGFIALDRDLNTVEGITFYQHEETPGLGGEIDDPRWKKTWYGKKVFDEEGRLRIEVVKGSVDPSKPEARFQIDGISGATLTSRGVHQLVRFWLGHNGYGPYLDRLREKMHG